MRWTRGVRASAVRLASVLLLGVLCPALGVADEWIEVPGGLDSVSRLMGGGLSEDPLTFFDSLNRRLLVATDPGHDWRDVEARVRLVEYLEDYRALEAFMTSPVDVATSSKRHRKYFRSLAGFLGYEVKFKGQSVQVSAAGGDKAEHRRRLAEALGWDLAAIAAELAAGGSARLNFEDGKAQLPLSFADWRLIVGNGPTFGTLQALATDQRLCFLLEGRRRLSEETRAVFEAVGWSWVYRKAPVTFYRYASALRVREGDLVIPGGEVSTRAWASLVGADPAYKEAFLRELLTMKNGRPAYLWHALTFLPPATAQFYLGTGEALTSEERQFVKKVFKRLDESSRVDFDHPRGGDLGFGTLARSLPLTSDSAALELPGGAGLWYAAIRDVDAPTTGEGVSRVARRGSQRPLDEAEFLMKALTESVKFTSHEKPALPRLIRTANMFPQAPGLLTPENVVLLARSTDTVPSALGVLDEMNLSAAKTIEQYLLAVFRLDSLDRNPDNELLILNFQGGVEWLRAMSRAGQVTDEWLEWQLGEWARIHWTATDPHAVAAAQSGWIRDLLLSLPDVSDQLPGRGPLERAMVAALTPFEDPQLFVWDGRGYRGERRHQIMQSMVGHLMFQGIPSADQMAALEGHLDALKKACFSADLEAAKESAYSATEILDGLGGDILANQIDNKKLARRLTATDRQQLTDRLEKIAGQRKARKLPRMIDEVEQAQRLLARELRPFLLAPGYLWVMADSANALFDDPHLIRKHVLIPRLDLNAATVELWQGAGLQMIEGGQLGDQIAGSVAAVTPALAEVTFGAGPGRNLVRDRVWFEDYLTTRWSDVTADTAALVSAAVDTGNEIVERAKLELEVGGTTEHAEFVAVWVAFARLERAATESPQVFRVSLSERFVVGLAALAEKSTGVDRRLAISDESWRAFLSASERLGSDWQRSLDVVGGATPALNGRVRPRLGFWPPYEAVEYEVLADALLERELLDVRLAVIDFLGRHELPGSLGRELMRRVLTDANSVVEFDGQRDWEGHIRWVASLDDDYFGAKLMACFDQGLYDREPVMADGSGR